MRTFLMLTALILLLLACGFLFDAYLTHATGQTAAQAEALSDPEALESVLKEWDRRARLLTLAIPQDELESIRDDLLVLGLYLRQGEETEALVQRTRVLSALESLRERYVLSPAGIL